MNLSLELTLDQSDYLYRKDKEEQADKQTLKIERQKEMIIGF